MIRFLGESGVGLIGFFLFLSLDLNCTSLAHGWSCLALLGFPSVRFCDCSGPRATPSLIEPKHSIKMNAIDYLLLELRCERKKSDEIVGAHVPKHLNPCF